MDYKKGSGDLSVLSISGKSIPEAWENSVVKLYEDGLWYKRAGRKDYGKLQVDSTMTIEIKDPFSDPFMHRFMSCGPEDLFDYQMEIMGAKNSWCDPTGESGRWPYLYNERLTSYPGSDNIPIDQIETLIEKIVRKSHSRQHNMITWVPERDNTSQDPPCLQRVWFGLIPDEESGDDSYVLNMNYNFRSRNAMIAAPMNMIGLSTIFAYVRDESAKRSGKNIKTGRMVDFNDSYHVSAKDQPVLENFMEKLQESNDKGETLGQRSYTRKWSLPLKDSVWDQLEKSIINQTENYLKGEALEKEVEKISKISKLVRKINESHLK